MAKSAHVQEIVCLYQGTHVITLNGEVRGRLTARITSHEISAQAVQDIDRFRIPCLRRQHQCRIAVAVTHVHIASLLCEHLDDVVEPSFRSVVDRAHLRLHE